MGPRLSGSRFHKRKFLAVQVPNRAPMAVLAAQSKARGRRPTRDRSTETRSKGQSERERALSWRPSLRPATAKRVTEHARSTSTTASDDSKRPRWNHKPEVGFAEEAESATGGSLKKQASGTTVHTRKEPNKAANRRRGSVRRKMESSGSESSEPSLHRRRPMSDGAKRYLTVAQTPWTAARESRTTRSTRHPSDNEYEEVPTAEDTIDAWNSSNHRPSAEQLKQLAATGWQAENRFESTGDEDFLFIPTEEGEREDGRRPPNARNRSEGDDTGRQFYRIIADSMTDATKQGQGLKDESNEFKSRQWNVFL